MQTKSSLTRFSVKPVETRYRDEVVSGGLPLALPEGNAGKRATQKRVGISVRFGHEDWYRIHDLAAREHTSLQGLILAGLNEVLKRKGLPPLAGH